MMSAFAAALDALFADPGIGTDATYAPDGGTPVAIRVVARRADAIATFADARIWSQTVLFDIRVIEVASPRPGDTITIGAESFIVQGEPERDRERLVWTVSLGKA